MKYQTTLLEDWIKEFYLNIDIYYPDQLDLLKIADRLGILVHFEEFSSRIYNGEIIIDCRLSPEEQWQDFAHELCHLLRQDGNQLLLMCDPLLDLQEAKADNFSLHFCVPTFMLLKYKITNYFNVQDGIPFVTKKFKVTQEFANKRLIHFRNQLQLSKSDQEIRVYMNSMYPKSNPENWSSETKSLLDKLKRQISKKNHQKELQSNAKTTSIL
ncbi:Zn-dependent peptidase ImmA (M78 family) [Chryseomicrobium aureum]|uniref:ImmA/IrrE family metallo-endopeptidase n=1 Tax=Chryseomicrobium aureum TaxID=1441723 RepID=UPI00195D7729|nr:ImmA/IrrE family metallo-endopeptidase [Chryseomicrobium aureum]MBM7707106.1 Zn-dependent peptidase ImmA (M78 family) [Chryseomicrobium aureum]